MSRCSKPFEAAPGPAGAGPAAAAPEGEQEGAADGAAPRADAAPDAAACCSYTWCAHTATNVAASADAATHTACTAARADA